MRNKTKNSHIFVSSDNKYLRCRAWELARRRKPVPPDAEIYEHCRALRLGGSGRCA